MSATVEELEALPEGAVVKDDDGDVWVKCKSSWKCGDAHFALNAAELVDEYGPVTILAPQGVDYSMYARLVQKPGFPLWRLEHPNGDPVTESWYSLGYAQQLGYPVEDTRTIEERVAEALKELDVDDTPYSVVAERLGELGLLAKDGES